MLTWNFVFIAANMTEQHYPHVLMRQFDHFHKDDVTSDRFVHKIIIKWWIVGRGDIEKWWINE